MHSLSLKVTITVIILKWYTFHTEKYVLFVSFRKQQIDIYMDIFNFKHVGRSFKLKLKNTLNGIWLEDKKIKKKSYIKR